MIKDSVVRRICLLFYIKFTIIRFCLTVADKEERLFSVMLQ